MNNLELLKYLQPIIHYGLHFIFPGLLAWILFRNNWKKAWLIMIATMVVDLDHLFSNPVFDPARCSIGHHILHMPYMILVYFFLLFFPKTRIIAVGLLFHMFTDYIDCSWMLYLKDFIA